MFISVSFAHIQDQKLGKQNIYLEQLTIAVAMSCPPTGTLNSTTWNDNCIITTNTTYRNLSAFKTCCEAYNGPNSVMQTYPNPPCYEYCQGHSSNVSTCFNKLVPSVNPPLTHGAVDLHCFLGSPATKTLPTAAASVNKTMPSAPGSTSSPSSMTISIPTSTSTKSSQGRVGKQKSLEAVTLVGLAVLTLLAHMAI